MTEPLETWIDGAVGEARKALVRNGRPIALRILRASDEGCRARWGETYRARIREIDRRRRGAFLDLGLSEQQGFLPLGDDGRARLGGEGVALTEGASVAVEVTREAARAKSPVVRLRSISVEPGPVGRLGRPDLDNDLAAAKPASAAVRSNLDEAIEMALSPRAQIPGGGVLTIEPTAALVSIDVDAAGRMGSGDPERFALDLNLAAAAEAARQIRLRNLGGVIAIDFVSMRTNAHQKQLEQAVREAFSGDPWNTQLGGLSRFGVYELSRAQLFAPLREQLCDASGRLSAETLALLALRAIEREAAAYGGRQIICSVAPEVMAWLDSDAIAWVEGLNNRIGRRWRIEGAQFERDHIDVRAL